MIFCNRQNCKVLYTIVCAIAFVVMVGYWFYKFEIEDRDIGVVDYLRLEDAKEIKFPVVSLCFENPFLGNSSTRYLRFPNSNVTGDQYRWYLAGENHDEMYEQIDYSNVTLDLRQYLMEGNVQWKNTSYKDLLSDSMHHFRVFDGFQPPSELLVIGILENFLKCFTLQYVVSSVSCKLKK